MLDERHLFQLPSDGEADGASNVVVVSSLTRVTLQVAEENGAPFVATVELHGRVHEALPFTKITEYTEPVVVVLEEKLQAIKLVVSGYQSGTLVAGVGGLLNVA